MEMQSFDFNSYGYRLFGIYHSPRSQVARDCGVVICHPIGHEYIRCYRAIKQLAVQLASTGFPVLRFDYLGSGNSEGEQSKGTLKKWIRDISVAVEELQSRSGSKRVSLIGLRLGATLAVMYATQNEGVEKAVLWDPVVVGKSYLTELEHQQDTHLKVFGYVSNNADCKAGVQDFKEILGFPYANGMINEIDQFEFIGNICGKLSRRVLLIDSCQILGDLQIEKYLKSFGIDVDYKRVSDSKIWLAEPYQALVPRQSIQTIIAWMSESDH